MALGRFARVALGLVGLLVVVAVTAGAPRPLGVSHGRGTLGPVVADYTYTTLTIALVALAALSVYAFLQLRKEDLVKNERVPWWKTWLMLMIVLAAIALLARAHLSTSGARTVHPRHFVQKRKPPPRPKQAPNARAPRFQWPEAAAIAAIAAVLAAAAIARRRRAFADETAERGPGLDVALALDESLDDLRSESDVRRAVIAAYARMERALARAGLPRRPAEAPHEYLERALRALAASAASVRALTDLFERAKFSQHPLGPEAKEDAIAALVAVRDEVRAAA